MASSGTGGVIGSTSPTISVPSYLSGSPLTDGAFDKSFPASPLIHPSLKVFIIILLVN